MENDILDYKFETKNINGRNFRVNANIDMKYFSNYANGAAMTADNKFTKFEEDDDVDSYSGDSNFLYESDENNEGENENNDLTQ